jgi:hypothetical protein
VGRLIAQSGEQEKEGNTNKQKKHGDGGMRTSDGELRLTWSWLRVSRLPTPRPLDLRKQASRRCA